MERNSRKLFSLLIICILMVSTCVFFTGCGSSSADGVKVSSTEQSDSDSASETKGAKDSKTEKSDKDEEKDSKKSEDTSDNRTDISEKSGNTASKKSSTSKTSSTSGTSSGSKTTRKKSSSPSTTETQQPARKTATVTVEGYCSGKTVTIEDGDTVYDVLKKSGASLKTESSAYGVYVVGINGLCEGDKGAGSGWTYTLNGEMVMKSASKVTVSDGANVKWTFVTKGL